MTVKNAISEEKNYKQYIDEDNIGYLYMLIWLYSNDKLEMRNVSIEESINMVDNNLNFIAKQVFE